MGIAQDQAVPREAEGQGAPVSDMRAGPGTLCRSLPTRGETQFDRVHHPILSHHRQLSMKLITIGVLSFAPGPFNPEAAFFGLKLPQLVSAVHMRQASNFTEKGG